jgi:hypothetical protein
MTRYDITLTQDDVDAIAADSTVAVTATPGLTFEVTSEAGWGAPSTTRGVYRFALDGHDLNRLRWGRTVTVLPVGFDGSVHFTADTSEVAR